MSFWLYLMSRWQSNACLTLACRTSPGHDLQGSRDRVNRSRERTMRTRLGFNIVVHL